MTRQYWIVVVGIGLLATLGRWHSASADEGQPSSDSATDVKAAAVATDGSAKEKAAAADKKEVANERAAKNSKKRATGDAAAAEAQAAPPVVELFGGVEEGKLEMKFIAKSDHDARVLITNKTKQPMTVQLPEAFAGVPAVLAQRMGGGGGGNRATNVGGNQGGGGNQGVGGGFGGGGGGLGGGGGGGFGGGGGGGGFFSIPPEQTAKLDVSVVCLDHGFHDPSSSKAYVMVPIDKYVDRPAVIELVKALGRGELQHSAAQAATWHLNNDLSWAELAAKQQGTVRSTYRPPYFNKAELQAGMAYANEAAQRGQLAEMARQQNAGATAPADSSEAISTAADNSREPGQDAKAKADGEKGDKAVPQKDAFQPAVGAAATQR